MCTRLDLRRCQHRKNYWSRCKTPCAQEGDRSKREQTQCGTRLERRNEGHRLENIDSVLALLGAGYSFQCWSRTSMSSVQKHTRAHAKRQKRGCTKRVTCGHTSLKHCAYTCTCPLCSRCSALSAGSSAIGATGRRRSGRPIQREPFHTIAAGSALMITTW